MSPTAEKDRAAARCNECGNIYPVNIHPEGDVEPIGAPYCRDCGGSEFTVFGDLGEDLVQIEEESP